MGTTNWMDFWRHWKAFIGDVPFRPWVRHRG